MKSIKTVLITGGSSGIGNAVARLFAANNWRVICHYFNSDQSAANLRKDLYTEGYMCRLVQGDLSELEGIINFINEIRNERIDSLINNAGSYIVQKKADELNYNDIIKVFSLNCFSAMLLSANIFSGMRNRRFGRIVNISSIAAKYGGSFNSMHYGCSKRALEGITKTLSREGARSNILVNTVRAGVIDTAFHSKFPKDMERRVEMIPIGRIGTPTEVAKIIFMLGSDLNTYITNEIVTVSGGE